MNPNSSPGAYGRNLSDFGTLSPAEARLQQACRRGEECVIGHEVPQTATRDNTVRAEVLRFFMLGGSAQAPVHETGVVITGAWISGHLDICSARVPQDCWIDKCRITEPIVAFGAQIQGSLSLQGSHIASLHADRICLTGGLFLRQGFQAYGEICLRGAQIEGHLDISRAKLLAHSSDALNCDSLRVGGSVFLTDGFSAHAEVRFVSAKIEGDLAMRGAQLLTHDTNALSCDRIRVGGSVFLNNEFTTTGSIRLHDAQVGSNLDLSNGDFVACHELNLQDAKIEGALLLRTLKAAPASINCVSASIKNWVDDQQSYIRDAAKSEYTKLILDGLQYQRFAGAAPTDAHFRLQWLDWQIPAHRGQATETSQFRPQPWQQLQRVLRDMGHLEEARQVGIAFEKRLRHARVIGRLPASYPHKFAAKVYGWVSRAFHAAFGLLIGYGYRPLRLGAWMLGVWLLCAALYWAAALHGIMGPSNPLVFQAQSSAQLALGKTGPRFQAQPRYNAACTQNWYLCQDLPEEYTGFSPLMYSLDVLLPLVDLQQERDWAPLIPTPKATWYQELFHWSWKHATRMVLWFEILFGWVASLLLVAVVSGLTKRRED